MRDVLVKCAHMDWLSLLKMLLLLLIKSLLVSPDAVLVHGSQVSGNHNLQCMSDYLFTINCSLNIPPTANTSHSNSSYWLTAEKRNQKKPFVCPLIQNAEDYFCSIEIPNTDIDYDYVSNAFMETDTYQFSLCHKQNEGVENCKLLMDRFKPFKNIKPNSPCCLNVSHQSGQHRFTWESTYEKYSEVTTLPETLKYELYYYKRGKEFSITSHTISVAITNYSVDDDKFLPDTEYSARVRSGPNQYYFQGQWSSWSSEINWSTKPTVDDLTSSTLKSRLAVMVFTPLCVTALLVLLLCYGPIKKWKQNAFIPTPAPYFHTLYHDCQGDFKSWVVTQENTADMLKTEETLQIDTLTKCADVQDKEEEEEEEEEGWPQCQNRFMEGSTYSNVSDPRCDVSLLGVPYAVSTMSPLSDPGSLTFSSPPGSPTEGDSGCWLSSHTSLEKDPPWYCNEYCTLSAFQQISPGPAMKPGTNREEQSGCHF
nr:interleukin-21 receptor-like isoform X2 [Labrus bergylta]